MTQLAANVNADVERWTLDSLPLTQYVQVDDETIEVRAMFPSTTYSLTGETLPPRIRVRRGIAGTTKASHLSGATLTPNYGLGSGAGAGGVTVDNQVDPPVAVTTLVIPGAVITGDSADALTLRPDQPTDVVLRIKDLSDDDVLTLNGAGEVRMFPSNPAAQPLLVAAAAAASGVVAVFRIVDDTDVMTIGGSDNIGSASVWIKQTDGLVPGLTVGGPGYQGGVLQAWPGNLAGDGADGKLGFYGATAVVQPVVPLTTPDVQDVIDALVALGLVIQSD